MGSGATPSGLDSSSATLWLLDIGQITTLLHLSFLIRKMGITTPNSNEYMSGSDALGQYSLSLNIRTLRQGGSSCPQSTPKRNRGSQRVGASSEGSLRSRLLAEIYAPAYLQAKPGLAPL